MERRLLDIIGTVSLVVSLIVCILYVPKVMTANVKYGSVMEKFYTNHTNYVKIREEKTNRILILRIKPDIIMTSKNKVDDIYSKLKLGEMYKFYLIDRDDIELVE